MTALVVDDEPIARQVLREALEEFSDVQILGEASTGTEAVDQILRHEPDIVFLDLHMPEMGGLAAVRSLRPDRAPLVIFVTAYQEHALDAFSVGAVDYLL